MTNPWPSALFSAEDYARRTLEGRECGHDFFHADRVRRTALRLQAVEDGDAGVIELAALLHDVADPKLVPDVAAAQKDLKDFLRGTGIPSADILHVLSILEGMSFGKELAGIHAEKTIEFQIVQDADRLDALGAIGIARCFAYGGSRNQALYDPAIPARTTLDPKGYRTEKSSSLNHFPEKLFLLKDRMNTATARQWAEERHEFLVEYRDTFLREWDGGDFGPVIPA
jgi:uncharacterized protein